ncbi:PH domain-containing protein [Maribacter flavus]|uniref:PH domain-containing protein n=1 Tax=Maribacter flavus TaxID=1658664 RepID=A0A5B2TU78_9FLAO|nr:PH domain-containing protein [Maribacter flavus]KAA2217180.1 PH domain-containing protein [Maribacter flavus]
MDLIVSFSVTKLWPTEEAQKMFGDFLRSDEQILNAYTHTRDNIVFTNRQLICYDVQGLTGSKKEWRFFPYSKISSFSIESAGTFDLDTDFKIWVSGVGMFEMKSHKNLNIRAIAKFLAKTIG